MTKARRSSLARAGKAAMTGADQAAADRERSRKYSRMVLVNARLNLDDPHVAGLVQDLVVTAYQQGAFLTAYWDAIHSDERALALALEAAPIKTDIGKEKRAKLLVQLRPSATTQPKRGRSTDIALRAVVGQADAYGWSLEVVAALLDLKGARAGGFQAILKALRDHNRRRVIAHRSG